MTNTARTKAQNVRVSLTLRAIQALREIVDSDPDASDKDVASVAILTYWKAWKERRKK